MILFIFLAALTGVSPAFAETPALVTWAFSASERISTNRKAGLIMSEKHPIFKVLKEGLPGYRHEYFYGTVDRVENELKTKKLTCYMASTSLEKRLPFSYQTPLAVLPSPLLVTRKDIAEKYQNKDKTLSLKDFVTNKELQGVFVQSRSYGPKIDAVLSMKDSLVQHQSVPPLGTNILRMIQSKRADFTVEYLSIFNDLMESKAGKADIMVALPIAEAQEGILMYTACSRTPEGFELIKKIDVLIQKNVSRPEYKGAMKFSGVNKAAEQAYEKQVADFVKKREKESQVY